MLETETRSKNGCKKQHFGHTQDFENHVAHLHQEFLGVFLMGIKHFSDYLANEISYRPDSWRGVLHI